jgi:hypothetical protein
MDNPHRVDILAEVNEEREYQVETFNDKFDDKNTLNDWVTYIGIHCGKASNWTAAPKQQREQMLKVAALAVAACEAFDKNGSFAPRHYEKDVKKDETT